MGPDIDTIRFSKHRSSCKYCSKRLKEWQKLVNGSVDWYTKPTSYWYCSEGFALFKRVEESRVRRNSRR